MKDDVGNVTEMRNKIDKENKDMYDAKRNRQEYIRKETILMAMKKAAKAHSEIDTWHHKTVKDIDSASEGDAALRGTDIVMSFMNGLHDKIKVMH